MERDHTDGEIHDLLRQPLGALASAVAFRWLRDYEAQALAAARAAGPREERQAGVNALRSELLRKLRDLLPDVVRLETHCDHDVSEAECRAERAYRERFEAAVSETLEDPAFDRAMAERVARAELWSFRQSLEQELETLVGQRRQRLRESVGRLLLYQGDA
jgi:hypothetical protein